MATIDLNDEKVFELVTEALRAGPGSPPWHEAVALLRQNGTSSSGDELSLLYAAREHLESGREYRSVRPGPRFTRKVMEEVERESAGGGAAHKAGLSVASIVAIASGVVLTIAIALVIYFTLPARTTTQAELEKLKSIYFVNPVVATQFESKLPEQWKAIGSLPLIFEHRLKAGPSVNADQGGGVVSSASLGPAEPFVIEVSVHPVPGDVVTQVFVTDDPQFSPDRATSPHELAWMCDEKGRTSAVLPDGRIQGESEAGPNSTEPLNVRMTIGKSVATIETDGRKLWDGAHQLSPEKPRYVGIRFLRRGSASATGAPTAESIRVLRASKP